MKTLLLILFAIMITTEEYVLDFGKLTGGDDWSIVNDDVMGGRSTSTAYLTDTFLHFEGDVSLENNGGFASIRSDYGTMDLSGYESVTLRVRGSERKFALSLDRSRAWYRPNYKFEFTPQGTDWQEFSIPLNQFKESAVGKFTGRTFPKEKQTDVIRMGIILYDNQAGPFELEVDYIKFQ
jgi:NADH dehydrogenase [ubiquinone] 1 alpha subcomplex assembly factor 1